MKQVTLLVALCVLVGACRKIDSWYFPNVNSKCDVVRYSTKPFTGLSFGNGLEKTYDERTGAVKTVRQMIALVFSDADSVYYDITYRYNSTQVIATIACLKKHFIMSYPDNIPQPILSQKDEHYTITAIFDRRRGRLVKMSGTTNPNQNPYQGSTPGVFDLIYQGDRLVSFGRKYLVYDSLGNITSIPRSDVTNTEITYGYDYSKSAKNQFYVSSGYYVHEYYNLAEICGWIPVQPKNLRIYQSYFWGDYQAGETFYNNHVVDANGFLQSYVDETSGVRVFNTWECGSHSFDNAK